MATAIMVMMFCCAAATADDRSLRLLFDSASRRVHIYDGILWKSKPLSISYRPATENRVHGEQMMEILSKGRRHVLAHQLLSPGILSLDSNATNPLWISWRFAAWNNFSLILSATASPRLRPDIIIPLRSSSPTPTRVTDLTTGNWIGDFGLLFDPDAPLSLIPPRLFFLLTDGSAASSAFNKSLAERIECVEIRNTEGNVTKIELQLCDSDMPYFGMHTENVIVISGGFWLTNYSAGQIDGHTGIMTLQIASLGQGTNINPETLEWVGAVVGGIVGLFMLYSRWATGPATLSAGTLYAHAFEADAEHWRYWLVDMRFILGSMLLAVFAIAANVIGWIAFGYATIPLTGVYFEMLIISFSVYGSVQALLAGLLTLADYNGSLTPLMEEMGETDSLKTLLLVPWLKPRYIPVGWAWVRQLLHVTAILALSSLAMVPVTFKGGIYGAIILLLLLLPPVLVGLFHHTYFVITGLGVACGDRRGILGFRHPGILVILAFELLLLLGYATAMILFLFQPLIDTTSAFFSSGPNYLLAIMLVALSMMGALFVSIREVTAVLHREANKKDSLRKRA